MSSLDCTAPLHDCGGWFTRVKIIEIIYPGVSLGRYTRYPRYTLGEY